jgi:hypothetical protein
MPALAVYADLDGELALAVLEPRDALVQSGRVAQRFVQQAARTSEGRIDERDGDARIALGERPHFPWDGREGGSHREGLGRGAY